MHCPLKDEVPTMHVTVYSRSIHGLSLVMVFHVVFLAALQLARHQVQNARQILTHSQQMLIARKIMFMLLLLLMLLCLHTAKIF